jgi:hypothetical protein
VAPGLNELLEPICVLLDLRLVHVMAEPTFSATLAGCQSIWIITRVEVSLRR